MCEPIVASEIQKIRIDLERFLKYKGIKYTNITANEGLDFVTFYFSGKKDNIRGSGYFSLSVYPGNRAILISHNMYISKTFRGLGIAKFLQDLKEEAAVKSKYSLMRCTTTEDNTAENHILETYGWKKIKEFKNKRSGNDCIEWEKDLNVSDNL